MLKKFWRFRDILWAAGIFVCLAAVFVGLVIVAFRKTGGSTERPQLDIGSLNIVDEGTAVSLPENSLVGSLHELTGTRDAGQEYLDSLTFLCDSALIGLRDYNILSGGEENSQVWGSSAGNIPVSSVSSCVIVYPGDGSEISAANAAMIKKPGILVISLGLDGLAEVSEDEFVSNFSTLIQSIFSASPSTKIICCSITSVTGDYKGADGLKAANVYNANEWLKTVCINNGVYYCDTASAVTSSGYLLSEYASSNGKALNSAGINKILDYLCTHALK